jgi:hypothetical protein
MSGRQKQTPLFYYQDGEWRAFPVPKSFNVYARVEGKLAHWRGDCANWKDAYFLGRDTVGLKHRGAVLVLIK